MSVFVTSKVFRQVSWLLERFTAYATMIWFLSCIKGWKQSNMRKTWGKHAVRFFTSVDANMLREIRRFSETLPTFWIITDEGFFWLRSFFFLINIIFKLVYYYQTNTYPPSVYLLLYLLPQCKRQEFNDKFLYDYLLIKKSIAANTSD